MDFLSQFPHITEAEFIRSIESFYSRYSNALEQSSYNYAVTRKPNSLQLARDLSSEVVSVSKKHEHSVDEVAEEHDEARMDRQTNSVLRPTVIYHITFSPIFRVPVLYFELLNLQTTGVALIDCVFQTLVPDMYKGQVEDIGVMGAITTAENPVTGRPALFIHPCNTAAAMSEVNNRSNDMPMRRYIELWIGLVGGCVGLYVPMTKL